MIIRRLEGILEDLDHVTKIKEKRNRIQSLSTDLIISSLQDLFNLLGDNYKKRNIKFIIKDLNRIC